MTKEERKEYDKQRYLKKKEEILEHQKLYRQEHKDQIKEYKKQYFQEHKESLKKHCQKHKEYKKQYNQEHKDEIREHNKLYYQTQKGRAIILSNAYNQVDKKYNRGECTLTAEWIIENIFSQPCHYCGEDDWHNIGCDRIDNSLPHTPDNVVPCCEECNKKRGTMPYEEFIKEITQVKQNTNANS